MVSKMRSNLWRIGRSIRLCHQRSFSVSSPPNAVNPETQIKRLPVLSLGQPTFKTHPEFLHSADEIMPGVTKQELRHRRTIAMKIAKEYANRSLDRPEEIFHMIIIPSSSKKYMTENIPYPFRQDSNFFYLSGSYDTDAFIVLLATPMEERHMMFVGDPDPIGELWDGPKTTPKAATDYFGFEEAYLSSEFPKFLQEFFAKQKNVVVWCENKNFVIRNMKDFFNVKEKLVENPKNILDSMRVVKSKSEIQLMDRSCQIASEAFQKTLQFCGTRSSSGKTVNEHDIWAKLDYECRLRGAERLAYPPVVASGARANIIHYVFNMNKCNNDELVLVDAGCEYFGYCSDITRTWPVGGTFSNDRHRSLYEMMLELQCELIDKVCPGMTLDQLFREMGSKLLKGLLRLGMIEVSNDILAKHAHEVALRFCPHHVSHYLGMDVHDTPTVDRGERLVPGMIITVEPGIYIRAMSNQKDLLTKVGHEFDGIAIRIEDDVLVTPEGSRVLTHACPKSIKDIELWTQKF